jgi:acetoin utilization deacetylase AcuC-like enzyme
MRVSYTPGYYAPIPEEHIFPMKKFKGLHRYLIEQKIIYPSDVIEPSMVDMANLMTVHSNRYSNGIMNGNLGTKELRRLGLPWSMGLAKRSMQR